MNEKLQYASMIEIPVNTCNITYKPLKKRKKRKALNEDVKQEVIEKVNSAVSVTEESETCKDETGLANGTENTVNVYPVENKKKKVGFKLTAISVQLMIIGALIATIFLTNAFNANSGINTFFKGVFSTTETLQTDSRTYNDFAPVLNSDSETLPTMSEGIITIESAGSVYSTCNGTVKSVVLNEETNKYTVEIGHSDNFTSVISGLDYVYSQIDGDVYSNIPLGYSEAGVEMCFYAGDDVITDYEIVDNSVVWAV